MRRYWQQLIHTDRPSDAELAKLSLLPLPFIRQDTYAGWTDAMQPPPNEWLDNLAETLVAPQGWAAIDHEDWPQDTQANRLLAADKFVTFYEGMKSRRPEVKFAFYGYAPKRDFFRARSYPGPADYLAWQAENDDMAAMAAVVDGFLPTIYHFYNVANSGAQANDGVAVYYTENIREAKRLRDTYGDPSRPVYPYIWWGAHSDPGWLDTEAWHPMIEIAMAEADGCILWGGFQETFADATWWPAFKDRLPKKRRQGAFASRTLAGG